MSTTVEFRLPDVGEGIAEAEIISWLVGEGQLVQLDEPLVLVETDKAQVELPSPMAGTVLSTHARVGESVRVGELLVTIGESATNTDSPRSSTSGNSAHPKAADHSTAPEHADRDRSARLVRASPHARKLAARNGINLTDIVGSGPDGRIIANDVTTTVAPNDRSALPATRPARSARAESHDTRVNSDRPSDEIVIPLKGLRKRIAESMNAARAIPHINEWREIDATNLLAAHAGLQSSRSGERRLTVFPLLLKAVLRALSRQPSMNGTYDDERKEVTRRVGVGLGFATATPDGLIVPVIRDAHQLSLFELADAVQDAAARARTRSSKPSELSGGSFTVTNFGALGGNLGLPVIRPPEIAIAGFGRISDRVLAVDGKPVVRPVLPIVVATDHRVNDGAELAMFVNDLTDAIANPYLMIT